MGKKQSRRVAAGWRKGKRDRCGGGGDEIKGRERKGGVITIWQNSQIRSERSRLAQFHPSTIKIFNLVPELSILVQFRPCAEMACRGGLSSSAHSQIILPTYVEMSILPLFFLVETSTSALPLTQPLSLPGSQATAPPSLLAVPSQLAHRLLPSRSLALAGRHAKSLLLQCRADLLKGEAEAQPEQGEK